MVAVSIIEIIIIDSYNEIRDFKTSYYTILFQRMKFKWPKNT
jgi:hypothetical protein